MSFMAVVSELASFPFVRMCQIDVSEGIENVAMTHTLFRDIAEKREGVGGQKVAPPPVSRGLRESDSAVPLNGPGHGADRRSVGRSIKQDVIGLRYVGLDSARYTQHSSTFSFYCLALRSKSSTQTPTCVVSCVHVFGQSFSKMITTYHSFTNKWRFTKKYLFTSCSRQL